MSKVIERAAASQLNMYLSANGLMPRLQSAYRKKHSTETAMLRIWSDVLTSADVQEVTLLGLLDLSRDVRLRRPRYTAAWTRSRIWSDERCTRVDTLVPE